MAFNNLVVPASRRRIENPAKSALDGPIKTRVKWGNKMVSLSQMESRLLHVLRSRNEPIERREIIHFVWAGRPEPKSIDNLHVLIKCLRTKMPGSVVSAGDGAFRYEKHDPWLKINPNARRDAVVASGLSVRLPS